MTVQRQAYFSILGSAALTLLQAAAPNSAAAAPTKDQCIDANTQAQNSKREGKLLSARLALRSCADLACPKLVQTDCTRRLDELEQSIPSVVFEVKDGTGHDLSAVTVTVDDKPLVDHLDGTAVELDPGAHVFTFKVLDQPPVTRSLVIQQGERGRREAITIGAAPPLVAPALVPVTAPVAAPAPAAAPVTPIAPEPAPTLPPVAPAEAPASGPSSARKTLAWTALGVGAAGLVVGGITAGLAVGKKKNIDDDPTCRQNACPPGEPNVSAYDNLRTVSSVGFIAGGVLAATGLVLMLTAPSESQHSAALWFGPGSAGVVGRFQ